MLLLVPRRISLKNLIFGISFIIISLSLGLYVDMTRYIKYLPVLFFIIIYKSSIKSEATIKFKYFLALFLLASSYSLFQNFFGLFSWDISFLQSGVGKIAEQGYITGHEDFRPFSLFSGVPEATLFYVLSLVIFIKRRSYILCIFAIILALISGSRGILVSFLMGTSLVFFFNKTTMHKNGLIWLSLITGSILYFTIFLASAYLSILQGEFQDNRLFFWGSMGGRIFYLIDLFSSFSSSNIFLPLLGEKKIYDNILVTLISDFGLVIAFSLLYGVYRCFYSPEYWSRVFLATLIIYGFFADNILSIYLLSIYAFGITILDKLSNTMEHR